MSISATFTLTLTLSLKGRGPSSTNFLRNIFFCLVTEEQKIGLLLNIAEKKAWPGMTASQLDAKKPTRPVKQKGKPSSLRR